MDDKVNKEINLPVLDFRYKEISQAFGIISKEYDSWYERNILFENELEAIKSLGPIPRPSLEVGVGTGRFAHALDITIGLDPSQEMLVLAKERGIKVICGVAETLPIKDQSLASISFFFTLCFVCNVKNSIKEAYRVLKPGGHLILGLVPCKSPWGTLYLEKGKKGHPLYKFAHFLSIEEVLTILKNTGFSLIKASSILFFNPKKTPKREVPRPGIHPEAGFVVMKWSK